MLWLFFAKPVSLKTMRGAEESAVSSLAGRLPGRQGTALLMYGWPAWHVDAIRGKHT